MIDTRWRLLGVLVVMTVLCGCSFEYPMYRMATDGVDKKEYLVVGRVTDSHAIPIKGCRVSLVICGLDCTIQRTSAVVTDADGNYQIAFELKRCYYDYRLIFDARDQGYGVREESMAHLLESTLFQYTGNNPVMMNVVMNRSIAVPFSAQRVEPATGY
jgi:hypothetical protein